MHIDTNNLEKPIFLQIAEQIEDSIFTGVYGEEERIPSTNEIAALLNINPHTVLKGVNLLVEEDILYKKRGLGMFVKEGAREKIRNKRKNAFFEQYIERLIQEDLLQPLDKSKLSNLDLLSEDVMGLEYDPENEYSIPYFWGTVGIVYDKNKVSEEDLQAHCYNIFLDTKYKGDIYLYDSERDSFMMARKALG